MYSICIGATEFFRVTDNRDSFHAINFLACAIQQLFGEPTPSIMRNDSKRHHPSPFRPYESGSSISSVISSDRPVVGKSCDFDVHSPSVIKCLQRQPSIVSSSRDLVPDEKLPVSSPYIDRPWKPLSPSLPVKKSTTPLSTKTVGPIREGLDDGSHRPGDPVARYLDLQI